MFSATPRAWPLIVSVMRRDWPDNISRVLHATVPPMLPGAGPVQVTPAGALTDWKAMKALGSVSMTVTPSAADGPLFVTVMP